MSNLHMVFATSLLERMRGLLGTTQDWGGDANALVIVPCKSIHTFFMRYALDVAFVDESGCVLLARRGIGPGRIISCRHARLVLERPSSDKPWLNAGQRVSLDLLVGQDLDSAG